MIILKMVQAYIGRIGLRMFLEVVCLSVISSSLWSATTAATDPQSRNCVPIHPNWHIAS
jgi:hypothetical protein